MSSIQQGFNTYSAGGRRKQKMSFLVRWVGSLVVLLCQVGDIVHSSRMTMAWHSVESCIQARINNPRLPMGIRRPLEHYVRPYCEFAK